MELIGASLIVVQLVDVAADEIVVVLDVVDAREAGEFLCQPLDVAVQIVAVVRAGAGIGVGVADLVAKVLLERSIRILEARRLGVDGIGSLCAGDREGVILDVGGIGVAAGLLGAFADFNARPRSSYLI